MPTAEDFARWREDFVTQFVFAAIERGVERQREEWLRRSWDHGVANSDVLAELRTRSDAYRALIDTDYAGWCSRLEMEPKQ